MNYEYYGWGIFGLSTPLERLFIIETCGFYDFA